MQNMMTFAQLKIWSTLCQQSR